MTFRFGQITDSHLYAPTSDMPWDQRDRFYIDAAREVAEHGVDFLVHTGDFVNGNIGVNGHRRYRALIDRISDELEIPVYLTRGNHDAAITDEQYEQVYGAGTWLLRHKGWAFLGIDKYFATYEHTLHAFCMSADTIDRVAELLADVSRDSPMVVLLHDDPVGVSRFHRGVELLHLLKPFNVRQLLFGHVQSSYVGRYASIPFATVTGDDRPHDTSPLSYNLVTCHDDGRIICDFRPYEVNLPSRPKVQVADGGDVRVADDWPSLRGPLGTRVAPLSLSDQAPRLAWQTDLPGRLGVSALTLVDGRLVVGTTTKGLENQCLVKSLDAHSGKVQWSVAADGSVEGGVLLHEGKGYYGTSVGSVVCVDLADGEIHWQWNNRDNMPIACQPACGDGLIHAGANWEMYAIEAATGRTRWRRIATPNGFTYMGPGNGSPLVVGDRVFHQRTFNAAADGVSLAQSVNAQDGSDRRICQEQTSMHPMYRHASPVFDGRHVWAVGNGLMKISAQGELVAEYQTALGSCSATPAVRDNLAWVSFHRQIVCIDLADGSLRWAVDHEPAMYHFSGNWHSKWGTGATPLGAYSSPLVTGDQIIVCDTGGNCRCLNAMTGSECWRLSLGQPLLAAPIVSGNTLFVAGWEGRIYALAWSI